MSEARGTHGMGRASLRMRVKQALERVEMLSKRMKEMASWME